MAEIQVKLVKSTIGAIPKHRKTVQALGLKRLVKLRLIRIMLKLEAWLSK